MKRAAVALAAASALVVAGVASAVSWQTPVGTNVVADAVFAGGGYPVPPGATKPDPGTCRSGLYNANRSESSIAVKPGTETLIGNSKIFFEKYSTFYDFHLGTVTFENGAVTGANQVQGYDCVSTGTQEMPPSCSEHERCRPRARSDAPLAAGGTPDHRGSIRPGALPAGRGAADRVAAGRSRGTCHLRCTPSGLRLRGGTGGNVNRGSRGEELPPLHGVRRAQDALAV